MSSLEQNDKWEQIDPPVCEICKGQGWYNNALDTPTDCSCKRKSIDDIPMDEWSRASRDGRQAIVDGAKRDSEAQHRKQRPVYSGVLKYFPKAMLEIAHCSFVANEQHNPGTEMHWDRSKSADEHDALVRHLLEAGGVDTDGIRHSTKVAWRALAALEKELENGG